MMVTLDPATPKNWAELFAWRNDPATRASSLTPDAVSLDAHLKWLKETLAKDTVSLFIVRDTIQGWKVGTARLERKNQTTAEISLTIAPGYRGRGYGTRVINSLTVMASPAMIIKADVKEENTASLRAFSSCGYEIRKIRKTEGGNVVEMVYTAPEAA